MAKYVRETNAAKSLSAYVILKGSREVATVQMHHAAACLVNVWQNGDAAVRSAAKGKGEPEAFRLQTSRASGYGYDKATAALAGLIIDGHVLTDHCARLDAPRKPKGSPCYPEGYKPPKGFRLANWSTFSRETGRTFHGYNWEDKARAELGLTEEQAREVWLEVREKARELRNAWEASPDAVRGYADCYREPGLSYLSARGYTVIQAI